MKRVHLLTLCAVFAFGSALATAPAPDSVPAAVTAEQQAQAAEMGAAPLPTPTPEDAPAPVAPVVTPLPDVPAPLTSAQTNELLAYLITFAGAALVRPLTALLQTWRVTAQIDAKLIASVLSLLMVTGIGWKQGIYGEGVKGVLMALAAGAAAFVYSYGKNRAASLSAEGGTRRAMLGRPKTTHGDVSTRAGLIPGNAEAEAYPLLNFEAGEAATLEPYKP